MGLMGIIGTIGIVAVRLGVTTDSTAGAVGAASEVSGVTDSATSISVSISISEGGIDVCGVSVSAGGVIVEACDSVCSSMSSTVCDCSLDGSSRALLGICAVFRFRRLRKAFAGKVDSGTENHGSCDVLRGRTRTEYRALTCG